jgi:hypothetical protein
MTAESEGNFHLVDENQSSCQEQAEPTAPVAASAGADGSPVLGGAMGNTPPNTRNVNRRFGTISEDTIHMSLWVDWGKNKGEFFDELKRVQGQSRNRSEQVDSPDLAGEVEDIDDVTIVDAMFDSAFGDDSLFDDRGYMDWGGIQWFVKPNGLGGGHGRSYYPYVLVNGGVTLALRSECTESISNVWLEFGSIPLALNAGLEGLWGRVKEDLVSEGVTIERELISRLDIYADYEGFDIQDICGKFASGARVCRGRKSVEYGVDDQFDHALNKVNDKYTGFNIGKSIRLRVYDKALELKRDGEKFNVFFGLYGTIPERMVRVEFQLRREILKKLFFDDRKGVEGVESYLAVRAQLWRYLTCDWFRLTKKPVDRENRNQDKAEVYPQWEMVQNSTCSSGVKVRRVSISSEFDYKSLRVMFVGVLAKLIVYEKRPYSDEARDILVYVKSLLFADGGKALNRALERHIRGWELKYGNFGGDGT